MKVGEVLGIIERFFLDVVGMVIPGSLLLLGLWAILDRPTFLGISTITPFSGGASDAVILIMSYVMGYAVSSFGDNILIRVVEWAITKRFINLEP